MEHLLQAINERHSVRRYKQIPIEAEAVANIREYIGALSAESGLDIRFCEDGASAFGGVMLKFVGWTAPAPAYIAFIGEKTPKTEEKCGYYGEKLVLYLQAIGLNTCWVGMFNKSGVKKALGGECIITIAVGYGETSGSPRKSKTPEKVTDISDGDAKFRTGIDCALKAPTAINQQKFFITRQDGALTIRAAGNGPFVYVDLGIVRYHFEVGSEQAIKIEF